MDIDTWKESKQEAGLQGMGLTERDGAIFSSGEIRLRQEYTGSPSTPHFSSSREMSLGSLKGTGEEAKSFRPEGGPVGLQPLGMSLTQCFNYSQSEVALKSPCFPNPV